MISCTRRFGPRAVNVLATAGIAFGAGLVAQSSGHSELFPPGLALIGFGAAAVQMSSINIAGVFPPRFGSVLSDFAGTAHPFSILLHPRYLCFCTI